jgi:hypothetical protein
MTESSRLTD